MSTPTTALDGLLMFEFESFGGSCCTEDTFASCNACDLAGSQKLFAYVATNRKNLAHFDKPNKYTFTFENAYVMPTHLTSFRERGGFGAGS